MSGEKRNGKQDDVAVVSVVPLVEDESTVSKRETVTGRVRVRTVTDITEELVQQELRGEHVDMKRVPVGVLVEPETQPPQIRTEGKVTILPILEEVLVIEKRLLVKEELRISRQATNEVTDIPVAVRKQRAVVERLDSEGENIAAISEQEQ
jgi:stress response protein YsnF